MDFLLPSGTGLKLTQLHQMHQQQLVLIVKSTSLLACCPTCQTSSRQVHSYYTRTIADLNWADRQVRLELHVRRFACANPACSRRTFAEQFGEQIKAYARRTKRCASQLGPALRKLSWAARVAGILHSDISSRPLHCPTLDRVQHCVHSVRLL